MTEQSPVHRGGFWTTLPGVLTGAATLVAAVTAMVAGLHAAGVINAGDEQVALPPDTAGAADVPAPAPEISQEAADVQIAGTWQAVIVYDSGNAHSETFKFVRHGHEVRGSASFLGAAKRIREGVIEGNRLTFATKTKESVGTESQNALHHYTGLVSGDEITFSMLTDGGLSSHAPIEFKALRTAF
jgi:hypothetical protein